MLNLSQLRHRENLPPIKATENYRLEPSILGFRDEHLPDDLIFFAAPPVQIGEVTNAYSTFKKESTFYPIALKRITYVLAIAAGLIIGYQCASALDSTIIGMMLTLAFFSSIFFFLAWSFMNGSNIYSCVYLGTKGLVHFRIHDSRDDITQHLLVFERAYVSQISVLKEGTLIETTDYEFCWYQNKNKIGIDSVMYTINTKHNKYEYAIGKKTEDKWMKYLYEQVVQKDIQEKGFYEHHPKIIFYKDHFTFQGKDNKEFKVDKSNLHELITKTFTEKYIEAEIQIPYLSLKQGEQIIPIAPLGALPIHPEYYNCGLLMEFLNKNIR